VVRQFLSLIFFIIFFALTACVSNTYYAPAVTAGQSPVEQQTYTVQPGDTLYSIAWAFGLDFRKLAETNHLKPPYAVSTGQQLILYASLQAQTEKTSTTPSRQKPEVTVTVVSGQTQPSISSEQIITVPTSAQPAVTKVKTKTGKTFTYRWNYKPVRSWIKPANGKFVDCFSTNYSGSKGIKIYGRLGEIIRAAASGQVVYSGYGVRGYGNMIIIKHNDAYLSAYAFNQKLLVKNGSYVKQGQPIATMGQNNAGKTMLYFELRKYGQPVNPAQYL